MFQIQSCNIKFNCTETVSACCDDDYIYKCEYFKPQSHPEYNFSRYCVHDENRCGVCASNDAQRDAMTLLLKQKHGMGTCRWKKITMTPIDYGEEGWNT